MRNERYYYSIMPEIERIAYRTIYDGLKNREYSIEVPLQLLPDQVQEIYLRVLYDNPLFYYINQTVIRMAGIPGSYILLPEYLYSAKEIALLNKDIRNVVNKVGAKANTMLDNEFRLEKFLHDSVVKSVAYDYDSLMKNDCFNAHSIVGAFLDKKAVCEGIAKAFKLLCNEFSIKCIVVLGKADPKGNFDGDSYHAWNLVKIGSESYYVDPTWDNMYDKGLEHISYDYFNVTTEDILKDHRPIGNLPTCTATRLNYFTCTNSFVDSYESLYKIIQQRQHGKAIMFKYLNSNGEFRSVEETYIKSYMALQQVMFTTRKYRKFNLLFNETHSIGKILFLD